MKKAPGFCPGLDYCAGCGKRFVDLGEVDTHKCDPPKPRKVGLKSIDQGRTFSDRLRDAELMSGEE